MGFLTSLLAVLTLLIVLATLTTALVETIHALLKQRLRGLQHMLMALFETNFDAEKKVVTGLTATEFARQLTTNPAVSKKQNNSKPLFPLVNWGNSAMFDNLSPKRFLQLLANSTLGTEIAKSADLAKRLDEVVAQFERFSESATQMFARRAAIYAPVLGIGLAAFMNADGAQIAQQLFLDEKLAKNVVVTFPRADLERIVEQANKDGRTSVELKQDQGKLETLGLPVGRRYFPYCDADSEVASKSSLDSRCKSIDEERGKDPVKFNSIWARLWANVSNSAFPGWLASILMTGILIGLGAPFWFDIYKKIAEFGLPGIPESIRKAISPGELPKTDATPQLRLKPEEMLKIFNDARAGVSLQPGS